MKRLWLCFFFSISACKYYEANSSRSKLKIFNGSVPTADEPGFYNTVSLYYAARGMSFCSGSILTNRHILTAKHCLLGMKAEEIRIFLGSNTALLNSDQTEASGQYAQEALRNVKRFAVYEPLGVPPEVKASAIESSYPNYDIGIIELVEPLPEKITEGNQTLFFMPLPLIESPTLLQPNSELIVSGFGLTESLAESGLKLAVPMLFDRFVDNNLFESLVIVKRKLNADGQSGMTCNGDSGGPVHMKQGDSWVIAGVHYGFVPQINSGGDDCSKRDSAISTSPVAYRAWLDAQISGQAVLTEKQSPPLAAVRNAGLFMELCTTLNNKDVRWYAMRRLIESLANAEMQAAGTEQQKIDLLQSRAILDCQHLNTIFNSLDHVEVKVSASDDFSNYDIDNFGIRVENYNDLKIFRDFYAALGKKIDLKVNFIDHSQKLQINSDVLDQIESLTVASNWDLDLKEDFAPHSIKKLSFRIGQRRFKLSSASLFELRQLETLRIKGTTRSMPSVENGKKFSTAEVKLLLDPASLPSSLKEIILENVRYHSTEHKNLKETGIKITILGASVDFDNL